MQITSVSGESVKASATPGSRSWTIPPPMIASKSSPTPMAVVSITRPGRRTRR